MSFRAPSSTDLWPARTAALLSLVAAVLAIAAFAKVPGQGRWTAELSDAAHGPAFAIVTLVIWALLGPAKNEKRSILGELALAVIIAILLGAFVELLQLRIGRDASFDDLIRDSLGALMAAGVVLATDSRARPERSKRRLRRTGVFVSSTTLLLLLAPLTLSAAAYLQRYDNFPTLVDFGSPLSTYFLGVYSSVTVVRSELPPELQAGSEAPVALHARLTGDEGWALALWEPVDDWRGFTRLNLDIANPTAVPLVVEVHVRDRSQSKDRRSGYRATIDVAPRSRAVRSVALTSLASGRGLAKVDVSQINSVVITGNDASKAKEFYVTRIWLD